MRTERMKIPQTCWPLALILISGCRDDAAGPSKPDGQSASTVASADEADCCKSPPAPVVAEPSTSATVANPPQIPDVTLRTHRGDSVRFYSDLVRGKVVAINFIFTTCKGVCPPLGVNFAALSRRMRDRLGKDLELISISVDPVNDGPEQLASWSRRFDPDPAWTLVTGEKGDVDRLLKALGVYSADKAQHSPFILLGDEATANWSRLHGLTAPEKVSEEITKLLNLRAASTPAPKENQGAHRYFTDVELVSHDGGSKRLYTDLLKGKVVVVQSFFCSCKAACPALVTNFSAIQERFKDQMGRDLRLLSISVDPERDTPAKLKEYADRVRAGPGWYFLTGKKSNVELALQKFGQKVDSPDNHSNLFVIGNDATGLWKKAMGLSNPASLLEIVASVLHDPGPANGGEAGTERGGESATAR
jgi:protein SCO1